VGIFEVVEGEQIRFKQFRGGLVLEAHRPLFHPALGLRVIKKRRKSGNV
jgi:hypothetical protein